ncbi:hypothetical protein JTE90_009246 [Oedothorax gibbosus]|uniref:Uncharacterized protein n=1 Tax=Oedothorax gibbosus TaxID=931172 RepID=A0AAV6TGY3_9ARAC|nr:hypothetical protein JTE90_009246 [Oedothorax gibbosus]
MRRAQWATLAKQELALWMNQTPWLRRPMRDGMRPMKGVGSAIRQSDDGHGSGILRSVNKLTAEATSLKMDDAPAGPIPRLARQSFPREVYARQVSRRVAVGA